MRSKEKAEIVHKKNICIFAIITFFSLITWLILRYICSSLYFSMLMFTPFLINTIFLLILINQENTKNKLLETNSIQKDSAFKVSIVIFIGMVIYVTVDTSIFLGIIIGINGFMCMLIYKIKKYDK